MLRPSDNELAKYSHLSPLKVSKTKGAVVEVILPGQSPMAPHL